MGEAKTFPENSLKITFTFFEGDGGKGNLYFDCILYCLRKLCVCVTETDCPSWGSLNWSQQEMVTLCTALSFTVEGGDAQELESGRWGQEEG